jgi:hypothetical protein
VIGFLRRLSDERYRRASKRRRTEEIMGWICVPVLIVVVWFSVKGWDDLMAERQPKGREQIMPAGVETVPLRR